MFSLEGEITPTTLAKFPDVLTVTRAEEDLEAVSADICLVLDEALAAHRRMREVEGAKLAQDVLGRADTIESIVGRGGGALAADGRRSHRQKLEGKMCELLQSTDRRRVAPADRGRHLR